MGGIGYSIFAASGLITLGVYSLVAAINAFLQASPISNNGESRHTAKPYYAVSAVHSPPESSGGDGFWWSIKQRAAIYLVVLWLVVAILHDLASAADFDPLIKGHTPVHRFTSLRSSAVLLLFLVLSLSLVFIPSLESRLFFSLLSASFLLQSTSSSSTSDLQGHLVSVSAHLCALSSFVSLGLAVNPKLFPFEVVLWASFVLQGFWNLQTGLLLYIDYFIPEGCHRLLDVPSGVDGSIKCELEDSLLRAVALADFLFALYVLLVLIIITSLYAILSKGCGGLRTRVASYDALPTSECNVQMKTLAGTQA